MAASLPPLPNSLKSIQHYLKTAIEHDKRDPAVAYYCRVYALQSGMEIDKASAEGRAFLMGLMDLAEGMKKGMSENESVMNEVVGQSHVENYALKLFLYADNEDRASRFGKNVVKSFYTAGMLFDVLTQFGELTEDIESNRKYAKWKAAYIHNCLKSGETPHSGPLDEETEEGGEAAGGVPAPIGFPEPGVGQPSQPYIPPSQPTPPPSQPSPYQPPAAAPVAAPRPAAAAQPQTWMPPPNAAGISLTPKEYQRAQKFCKYASSALQYEDSNTAIDNLTKALKLLTTGTE